MPTLLGTGEAVDDTDDPDDAGDGHHTGPDEGTGAPRRRLPALPGWLPTVAVAGITALAVALRLYSPSNLWLDEALSFNIARLPVGDLLEALRHDGHPPLYYLLLHLWAGVFGESDGAVRALSSLFGLACLPLAWLAGRRLAGVAGGRWALVVVGLSPYAVRYSTETRMYSLVMLLVLAGYLLLGDALRAPRAWRLGGLALISGALLLSHYWAFWLLGGLGLVLALRWWRLRDERRTTALVMGAIAVGGLLFVPWLPSFLYQAGHTGTPWADPMRPTSIVHATLADMGGGTNLAEGALGGFAVAVLCLVALFTVRARGRNLVLDLATAPTVRWELAVVGVTLVVGAVIGYATSATFQSRYAAVVVPLILLAAAVGLSRIPGVARLVAGGALVVLSLVGVAWTLYFERTQSGEVADAVAANAQPGDVVVYCPDQLGPAYAREMPEGLVEVAYPTLERPERVDWVDYAERNAAANPEEIAAEVRRMADGNGVFFVWRSAYLTFGSQCEELIHQVGQGASTQTLVTADPARYYEPAGLLWYPSVSR